MNMNYLILSSLGPGEVMFHFVYEQIEARGYMSRLTVAEQ